MAVAASHFTLCHFCQNHFHLSTCLQQFANTFHFGFWVDVIELQHKWVFDTAVLTALLLHVSQELLLPLPFD